MTTSLTTAADPNTPALQLPERVTLTEAASVLRDLLAQLHDAKVPPATVTPTATPVMHLGAGALQRFDSSVLAVLLGLQRAAQARGLGLVLAHVPQRLRDLMRVYAAEPFLELR